MISSVFKALDVGLFGLQIARRSISSVSFEIRSLRSSLKSRSSLKKYSSTCPLGISPLLKKSMASHIESISEYPDRDYKELRSTLALYCNVPMEHIIVGNGATEMISLTMQLIDSI